MPPNLVVVALEGVSQTLFWQYREAMPSLWELFQNSASFRRFYSTSTSAFQSFCDFAHGDATELDHNAAYPDKPGCLAGRATNFFGIARDRGYTVRGLMRANPVPPYAVDNVWGAWPESCGPFECHAEYDSFYGATDGILEQAAQDGTPFVLYYSDRASRPGDKTQEKENLPLYHERFEKGFNLLDRSVGRMMKKLSALNLLSNTIVVFFGPYGMDPWNHGIELGRTHAIDPYADLCWTPFFIFRNGNDAGFVDLLVSSIDLKPTLLHLLFPENPPPPTDDPLAGVDILRFQRKTAFSQNLFALERDGEGSARGLSKSYAATDGDQRLLVASEQGVFREGGMELYFDPRDPGNTRNFLDFFTLDAGGTMVGFGKPDIIHVHFTQSFKPNLVMSVVNSFNLMRPQLREFIRIKESRAQQFLGSTGDGGLFSPDSFTRKRKRR